MPEAKLLENDFYMSENLNTENNLLVPSTRRNLFKGVATGLVAGSVAGPAILSGAKRGRKQALKKAELISQWCPGVLRITGVWKRHVSMQEIWVVRVLS